MSQQREAGLAALQSSDFTGAIALLEEACQIAPEDYDSHLYLGAAYGGAGRQMDAINALTKSVQIQPANGQARYNLGVAMERAGYSDQAKLAFEQALMLQPEYPQAQQALQRLTGMSSVAQAPLSPPQQAQQTYQSQQPAPQYGAPPQPSAQYGSPQLSAQQSGASQKPAPLYGAPQQNELAGYTPPGQPASSPLPAYGQLSQQSLPYGAPGPSIYPSNARYYVEDAFDLKQAWKDLWMTITAPVQFFDSQIDREGFKAPTSFILMGIIVTLVLGLTQVVSNPVILVVLPLSFPFQCLGMLIYGGIYHLIGKLFGNSSNYSASYRVATYSFGPTFVLGGISSFIIGILFLTGAFHVPGANPGATGASPADISKMFSQSSGINLVSGIFGGLGMIWAFALACIGIGRCQKTSTGAGVGTVVVSWLITILLVVVPLTLLFVAIITALAAAGGAR